MSDLIRKYNDLTNLLNHKIKVLQEELNALKASAALPGLDPHKAVQAKVGAELGKSIAKKLNQKEVNVEKDEMAKTMEESFNYGIYKVAQQMKKNGPSKLVEKTASYLKTKNVNSDSKHVPDAMGSKVITLSENMIYGGFPTIKNKK